MKVTTKMYTILFNGITDAIKKLEESIEILKNAQINAENEYIENKEE